jgi:hypothetical protein
MLPPVRKGLRISRVVERLMTFTVYDYPVAHFQVLQSPPYHLGKSAWSFVLVPPRSESDIDFSILQLHNLSNEALTVSVLGGAVIKLKESDALAREEFQNDSSNSFAIENCFSTHATLIDSGGSVSLKAEKLTLEALSKCSELSLTVQVVVYGSIEAIECPDPAIMPDSGRSLTHDISRLLKIDLTEKSETIISTPETALGDRKCIVTNVEYDHSDADTNNLSDIDLVCGPMHLHCHKAILAARSPVFQKKFSSWQSKLSLFFSGNKQYISTCKPEVLRALVIFIYTDEVSKVDLVQHAFHLLILAAKYQLQKLMTVCESFLAAGLIPECAANFLQMATKLGLTAFAEICEEFITRNLTEVSALDPSYQNLGGKQFRHLLEKASVKTFEEKFLEEPRITRKRIATTILDELKDTDKQEVFITNEVNVMRRKEEVVDRVESKVASPEEM